MKPNANPTEQQRKFSKNNNNIFVYEFLVNVRFRKYVTSPGEQVDYNVSILKCYFHARKRL